jgi:nucleoside 2-deoxyribosyltransferase
MKTITICGSMQFLLEMEQLKKELERMSFKVFIPSEERIDSDDSKQVFIDEHIEKIRNSDAVLIANYSKNGVENYIGPSSFMEMAFAYVLKKKILILNSIPKQSNTGEIESLKPIVLDGDLALLSNAV